ncbi:Peptidase family M23 [Acinetobacter marinus]|uniref:Peptidase family M23 n=2 Tax=Acinetobacter marinus TaxID=281375 RepID=A0A1G6GYZ8_9GAMM|nr:Peptidase family M23 [Acinetobacter marinus]
MIRQRMTRFIPQRSRNLNGKAWQSVVVIIFSGLFLSACEPPKSSESAGARSVMLYWKLQQQSMPTQVAIPVQGVTHSQITDTWGAARSAGRKHQGVDIFAPRGTPVLASTHGIVSRLGTNNLGGNVVWVVGPDRSRHYYAHLDSYAAHIQEGDWVEAGEVLAYVGNSGNAKTTPPHLHYGIYLNGQGVVNPYPYLQEAN